MSELRKPITLAVIAAFAIGLVVTGEKEGAGFLLFAFILYLVFGDD